MGLRVYLLLILTISFVFLSACKKEKYNVPEVSTGAASSVTSRYAVCSGAIASDGGAIVYQRGICYSTSSNPTIDDSKALNGVSTGDFTVKLNGLRTKTTYYFCAFATNYAGTAYGSISSFTTPDYPIFDADGIGYDTVNIGTQVWMMQNLKVTHYRNGDAIPEVTDTTQWQNATTGAYCKYNNDNNMSAVYGKLYNWYAVNDSRNLAPSGWHVASENDWLTMIGYLGDTAIAGGKLKESGTSHWLSPNSGASNSSGFTALPAGFRSDVGRYSNVNSTGHFWCTTEMTLQKAYGFSLYRDFPVIYQDTISKNVGLSVRCIKD